MRLAGTFSADDPRALVRFLSRYDTVSVTQVRGGWVIAERR